ncbi:MAG: ABC transporter substrate-binding protein [Gammaproteobacteria bacterium]|nr:ABC transporter substrate-binding protein [Gammaproteobacteria bacterium]
MTDSILRSRTGIWKYLVILLFFLSTTSFGAEMDRQRIGFLTGIEPENAFFSQMVKIMQVAADDLNTELIVANDPSRSTYTTKRIGSKLIASEPKLDFFITKYFDGVTPTHIKEAKLRGIKVFVLNSDVSESDYPLVGKLPREKFENWIGHMVPDDRTAGYELADSLLKHATKTIGADKELHFFALHGPADTSVVKLRVKGMKQRIGRSLNNLILRQEVVNWTAEDAENKIVELHQSDPEMDVVWGFNAAITWGAYQGLEKIGKQPGKNVIIGGFDYNSESIKAIADGKISTVMFGHFLEGAWALVLCHDYAHGVDFANSTGVRISTPLSIMDTSNYKQYQTLLKKENWEKIDFKEFSKMHNPNLSEYNFKISQFLK